MLKVIGKKTILLSVLILIVAISAYATYRFYSTKNPQKQLNISDLKTSVLGTVQNISMPKIFIVQSGSMEPTIMTGSLAFTYPAPYYAPGDIITFHERGTKTMVTHRAIFKDYPNGNSNPAVYITAGDANKDFDAWQVTDDQIVGKVFLDIPYVGYLADFAKKPQGFILLVIIPATIVIYEELKTLLGELVSSAKSGFDKLKRRRTEKQVNLVLDQAKPQHNYHRASIVLPIIGSLLIVGAFSVSYYMDVEKTIGNVFGASDTFTQEAPPANDQLLQYQTENPIVSTGSGELVASPTPTPNE